MSEILARIRVRETHGIRRFLYPLWASVALPKSINLAQLSLTLPDGTPVPLQVDGEEEGTRLDFAVSLAPREEVEMSLVAGMAPGSVPDPLHVTSSETDCSFQSAQERLRVTIGPDALVHEIVYDGLAHLRAPLKLTPSETGEIVFAEVQGGPLSASAAIYRKAADRSIYTYSELTACKSWVTVNRHESSWAANEEIVFILPLAVSSPTLTCDFGVGGGIYGKLQAGAADEVVWRSEFAEDGTVRWSVATNGRVDYTGTVASRADYLAQQWFHLLDSDKAIAVAIFGVPKACRTLCVTLSVTGDIAIAFTMGAPASGTADFRVCYHFLNDVPAIAAATNPQSILLPPTVEVLPAN